MEILNDNDRWLDDKLCKCDRYIYPHGYDWDREFQDMLRPPYCGACGKWAHRVQMCVRCSQNYYQFFWHPLMGWHPSLARYGWECWDCLETFKRDVFRPLRGPKRPPPACVISPYYVKLVLAPPSEEMQALLDSLDSI